ncbi:glucose-6-phosphatase b [Denticeps clupeoides]|uniref:glucose-6-phosphatase b n=1 Tax=Denticeps clupeoides TaxID=299321 RepID=UPI0010A3A9AB|nr:glucose-6-phosphatase-like [Denticeps clupeoides]
MDTIHRYGVSSTQYLQVHYPNMQDWFLFISAVADLRTTFLVFFPVWFHFQAATGVKLVWVAVVGDWLNLVCKWVLFGERPYWWVQETFFYGNSTVPQIKQFPMTCETGPGSPSGHAMGAAGVYHAMISSLASIILKCNGNGRCIKAVLWALFWCIQISVCLSRVFIAAHFPHQVIAGVLAGVAVAKAFDRVIWIHGARFRSYVQTTLLLIIVALGLYVLLDAAAVDPLWSLAKARKWCARPEWVRLETTPFASLLRNTGTLFGLGLALNLPLVDQAATECGYVVRGVAPFRLACAGASLPLLHVLDSFRPQVHTQLLFYLLSFCKSATMPLATIGVVPYCVDRAFSVVRTLSKHPRK